MWWCLVAGDASTDQTVFWGRATSPGAMLAFDLRGGGGVVDLVGLGWRYAFRGSITDDVPRGGLCSMVTPLPDLYSFRCGQQDLATCSSCALARPVLRISPRSCSWSMSMSSITLLERGGAGNLCS